MYREVPYPTLSRRGIYFLEIIRNVNAYDRKKKRNERAKTSFDIRNVRNTPLTSRDPPNFCSFSQTYSFNK